MIEDSRHANENKTWFVESLGKIVVHISADADKADDPDGDQQMTLMQIKQTTTWTHKVSLICLPMSKT
jgi:hypothetical protein